MISRRAVDLTIRYLAVIGILSIASVRCVCAQDIPPGCTEVCGASCLKPWTFADRWDDSPLPGSNLWGYNGTYDAEKYTDSNNNLYYDPGEPFIDGSSAYTRVIGAAGPKDGQYSEEYYDPLNTGYVAWKDLGLELTLKYGSPSGVSVSSQYIPIDLPIPGSGSTGADRYRQNIANCNPTPYGPGDTLTTGNGDLKGPTAQGMRDLIDQDPGAYWDDSCQCVKSQYGDHSPRIMFIPLYDPRVPLQPGKKDVIVTKIAAFFIESADVNGNMKGRLIVVEAPGGTTCAGGGGGFLYDCPVVVKPTTWGRVKSLYR
jgi:hypothetical protein